MSWVSPRKRAFDAFVILAVSPLLLPILLSCVAAIFAIEGRPVFYRSLRRVYQQNSMVITKFRTMRIDAERIANRQTVPVTSTRFLNIPSDSPLYTPIGRLIERTMMTEMPQLLHVLAGRMSLVGNRPLPENVIEALKVTHDKVTHDNVEARFATPAGLTGPAQLVGRDFISDADRLRLESAYCQVASHCYSMLLDLKILLYTALVGLIPTMRFSVEEVMALIERHEERGAAAKAGQILVAQGATPNPRLERDPAGLRSRVG